MTDDLDSLSTQELHDRALHRAERHLDLGFFWSLLRVLPAAEVARGDVGEADTDIQASRALILDALRSGDGDLGESLRPLFIDYLRKHGRGEPGEGEPGEGGSGGGDGKPGEGELGDG